MVHRPRISGRAAGGVMKTHETYIALSCGYVVLQAIPTLAMYCHAGPKGAFMWFVCSTAAIAAIVNAMTSIMNGDI